MKFSEWLKDRLVKSRTIKNANQLSLALSTPERRCNRATVSLWLSGDRYPKKYYLNKIVDLLHKSKADKKRMILEIWELEDGLK